MNKHNHINTYQIVNTNIIAECLSQLFSTREKADIVVEIISRNHSSDGGTYPAEIIECKLNHEFLTLRCKYGGGVADKNFSHRQGIIYEGRIYTEILKNTSLSTIPFYGFSHIPENNETFLVMKYLDDCSSIGKSNSNSLEKAAEWIGRLHSAYETKVPSFVKTYDASYYNLWAQRVDGLVQGLAVKYPWLPRLRNYFIENIHILTKAPLTLIHGEFYQKNILIRNEVIYPVDWESAAIGPGEIDVASLIDCRNPQSVKLAVETYQKNRWKNRSVEQSAFEQRLLLARIYFYFRWMSEDHYVNVQGWMNSKWISLHMQQLAKEAKCYE